MKIADSIYMLEHSQWPSNATVVFTDDGVLVFDFTSSLPINSGSFRKPLTKKFAI